MSGGEILIGGLKRLARIGVNAAFPLRCWQCEAFYLPQGTDAHQVDDEETIAIGRWVAPYLCKNCASGIRSIHHPLCPACGRPFKTDHGVDHHCHDCFGQAPAFDAARAAVAFDEPVKTLVHHYKYQGRTELARPLGKVLWNALIRFYDPQEFDLVVPVPLHWYRRYRRGFNQAAVLLQDWRQYAADGGIQWNSDRITNRVLVRKRRTSAQIGLGKRARAANLKGAFMAPNSEEIDNKRILLVDDVLTTGATVVACATALKHAGAAAVKVLTIARAI